MSEPTLIVRVERSGRGRPRVLAPAVGWWSDPPQPGTLVGPGSNVGRLRCLNRRFVLILPDGPAGAVERTADTRLVAVGFAEVLFRLRPLADAGSGPGAAAPTAVAETSRGDLPEGVMMLRRTPKMLWARRRQAPTRR